MDRNFGYYVFLGLLIGAAMGFGLGTANGNTFIGVGLGILAGVFIGWTILFICREPRQPWSVLWQDMKWFQ